MIVWKYNDIRNEVRPLDKQQILSCALDIGEQMLISGAEVSRVELAIRMICTAYGCQRADVFIITSSMILTVEDPDGSHATQTRRLNGTATDLTKLHRLNALSRRICAETPSYADVRGQLDAICREKPYSAWLQMLAGGIIAFSFTVFFGGSWIDGLVAGFLGICLRGLAHLLQRTAANQIIVNVIASFCLSLGAIGLVRLGLGQDANKILIGNIMILIPGIALTNSLRDLISGDIMTGLLRFLDAILVAAAIAAGYILAAQLMGGVLS